VVGRKGKIATGGGGEGAVRTVVAVVLLGVQGDTSLADLGGCRVTLENKTS
jgi:hypothetical protein